MATPKVAQPSDVPSARVSSQRIEPGSVNVPVHNWTSAGSSPSDPESVAKEVIKAINDALTKGDVLALAGLFIDDCYWRDHLTLSWELRTFKGKDKVTEFLEQNGCTLKSIEANTSHPFTAARIGAFDGVGEVKGVEFAFNFKSEQGAGKGTSRLSEDKDGKWKIFSFFTQLTELAGFEEPLGARRPAGVKHGGQPGRKNWKETRQAELNYEDGKEPSVLIVGAGQAGLTLAARLKMLNVDALMVDRNDNIGDNWRGRYHQLTLHDPVWFDHMPYLPFPAHWPVFTPKDKLGQWFETYARSLELNVWMKTNIKSSSWSESEHRWTVTVERTKKDGTKETRTFHPRHLVQATGHSGKKNFPTMKGMENFKGHLLCHSSEFPGARPSKGETRKAVVVGCCNSGHDISQSFYENGYDVTMVQRSSTCVISSESITEISLGGLYDETGPPTEDADTWLMGTPTSVLKHIQIKVTALQGEKDKATLEGLKKAGFKLDSGPDNAGLFIKYFQRGGGYYIDVGASQLIVDGKIKIKQGQEIDEILPHGIRFADGTELEADEIIFATGYQNMRSEARTIFGDELADRVGDIWGFNEEGEFRTIWQKSGHPAFWFMGGNLGFCRYYSRILALQIKAREEGLVK